MSEVYPKRTASHYDGSQLRKYPRALLVYRYGFRGHSKYQLQYTHQHTVGSPCPVLELVGWNEVTNWLTEFSSDTDVRGVKGINISGRSDISIEFLELILKNKPNFEALHLDDLVQLDTKKLSIIVSKFANLHTLSLAGYDQLKDVDVEKIMSNASLVKHLDISRCSQLTNLSLLAIAKNIGHITVLIASHNPHFTVEGANELIMYCEHMHKLDFSNCDALHFIGIIISLHGMIQYGSWNIKDINLNYCSQLHLESLMWLEAANSHLHNVQLRGLKHLNDAVVSGIASGCEELRLLDIEGCKKVGSGAVLAIAANCGHNLTFLNICRVGKDLDSAAIKALLSNCSALTHLNMEGNKKITDAAFVDISASSSNVGCDSHTKSGHHRRHAQLTYLNIAGCHKISTYGVSVIAQTNPSLVHLELSGLKNLTDIALSVIGACCGKTLIVLKADDCERLTDVGVAHVATHCRVLETLSLSTSVRFIDSWMHRVEQFTDKALENILLGLPRLQSLAMRNQCALIFSSPKLNVDFPKAGGHFCLSEVDLKGCDCLHQAGLNRVLSHCYNLSSIWLSDTKAMPWVKSQAFLHHAFRNAVYSTTIAAVATDQKSMIETMKLTKKSMKAMHGKDVSGVGGAVDAGSQLSVSAPPSRKGSIASLTSSVGSESIASASKPSISSSVAGSIIDPSEIDNPRYIQVLVPLPNASFLQWRDKFARRRLLELYSCRVIQHRFRIYRFWKRIKRFVRARQIAQWYKNILDDRKYKIQ